MPAGPDSELGTDVDALDGDPLDVDPLDVDALDVDALDVDPLDVDPLDVDPLDVDALSGTAGGVLAELPGVSASVEWQAISSNRVGVRAGLGPQVVMGDMTILVRVGGRARPAVLPTAVVDAHVRSERLLRMNVLRHLQAELSGKDRFCRVLLDFVQTLHRNAAIDASKPTNEPAMLR